jgi:hypothetical protein
MPVQGGSALKSFLQASRPPAEAPIPTTQRLADAFREARAEEGGPLDCGPARGQDVGATDILVLFSREHLKQATRVHCMIATDGLRASYGCCRGAVNR